MPVYKGGYAGLFKHLIDLLDMKLLDQRPVIAAATGNTDRHASVINFHLRPLFSFFGARMLPERWSTYSKRGSSARCSTCSASTCARWIHIGAIAPARPCRPRCTRTRTTAVRS